MSFRVEELAVDAALSVDTIRYYQKIGLLDPPEREGRVAVYSAAHRARLDEIARLSDEGFTLAQIARLSDHPDDRLLSALRQDDTEVISRSELADRAEIEPELVELAIDAGLVRSTDASGDTFGPDAVEMLTSARTILATGLPIDALVALAVDHASHVEGIVDTAIDLFRRHLPDDTDPATAITELVPAVSALVAQHFRHTLVDRATARLQTEEVTS